MDEIEKIERAIAKINENPNDGNMGLRSRLEAVLMNLNILTSDMASYIKGDIDPSMIDHLNQTKDWNFQNNNYTAYLSNLSELSHLERVRSICLSQTPDEKAYFLNQYAKHQENKKDNQKVLR
jgi:hypothetical protein